MHEIVRYHPGLKEQIARLQRHLWSDDVRLNTAYFEWKYEENPFIKVPLLQLALSADRVIGMRGMFGSCWEVGSASRRVLVPCADDFVIDPEHRNHGIGGAIMRAAVEDAALSDYEYAFSVSAGPITLAASLVARWRAVGSMRPARRTSAGARFVNRMAARLRTAPVLWRYANPLVRAHHRGVGGPFRTLDRRGRRTGGLSSAAVRVEAAPRADAMADVVARLGHDGRLRHVRDETYLRWRYRDPLHEYRFLVQGADRLRGYLVLSSAPRGARARNQDRRLGSDDARDPDGSAPRRTGVGALSRADRLERNAAERDGRATRRARVRPHELGLAAPGSRHHDDPARRPRPRRRRADPRGTGSWIWPAGTCA